MTSYTNSTGAADIPSTEDRVADATLFLETVYGSTAAKVVINKPTDRGVQIAGLMPVSELIDDVKGIIDGADNPSVKAIYVLVSTLERKPSKGRGREVDAVELPAFFMDIDLADGVHADAKSGLPHPSSQEQILMIIEGMGLPTPTVVHSGGGLQLWWPFADAWIFDSADDRAEAKRALVAFQEGIISKFAECGLHCDKTASLAQLLRIPGSLNRKDPNAVKPVRLLSVGKPTSVGVLLKATTGAMSPPPPPPTKKDCAEHSRIGKSYAEIGNWDELLTSHGWERVREDEDAGKEYWKHPEATYAHSATVDHDALNKLFVFSSSTGFKPGRYYDLFEAYTILNFGDQDKAAYEKAETKLVGDGLVNPSSTYEMTDYGNAVLLIDRYQDSIGFFHPRDSWMAWNGQRWTTDAGESVVVKWTDIAVDMPQVLDEDKYWRTYSLSSNGVRNALWQARRNPRIIIEPDSFDQRPDELNTPTGIVDLRTGEVLPHDPKKMHSKITAVAPDFESTPTKWLAFLDETFAGDQEVIDYMQKLMGQALRGNSSAELLPFAHGPGGCGKGTYFDTITRTLGLDEDGYASAVQSSLILEGNSEHPVEIAKLYGARVVLMSELNQNQKFDEAKMNWLTGNDTLEGRFMHKNPFKFRPTHTFFLFGNNKPRVQTGGDSFWRRVRLIPFLNKPKKANSNLKEDLFNFEGPAILAWAIRGSVKFEDEGLETPRTVESATEEYRTDEDILGAFLEEECVVDEIGTPDSDMSTVTTKNFYDRYATWCEENGYKPYSTTNVGKMMKSGNYRPIVGARGGSARLYKGVRLMNNRVPKNFTKAPDGQWTTRET